MADTAPLTTSDFLRAYDEQIAARNQEIEDTRQLERWTCDNLGADQCGTSRVPGMEQERDGLLAQRQVFVDAQSNAQAVQAAQGGNPWPLAGRVAEVYGENPLVGLGVGHVAESVFGRIAAGLGRLRAGRAAARAGAGTPAAEPTPVEPCPVDPPPPRPTAPEPKPLYGSVNVGGTTYYGPFFRTPLTSAEMGQVLSSNEVWGAPSRNTYGGGTPMVKAVIGELPKSTQGYEFYTTVQPTSVNRGQMWADWRQGQPGVLDRGYDPANNREYVAIPAHISNETVTSANRGLGVPGGGRTD